MAIDTLGANALASDSVTTAKIANDAVTGAKIPDDAVVAADIADGSITSAKLDTNIAIGGTLVNTGLITASAGVAIGGTGAANTLDDYEEGTWTPSVSAGAISGTSITYSGTYTKVGRSLLLNFKAHSTSGDINVSSYVALSGVPFTILSDRDGTSTVLTEDIDQFDRQGFAQVQGTVLYLSNCGSSSGTGSLKVSVVAPTT